MSDNPEYDIKEFNVAATDDRGHYEKVGLNVPPPVAKQIHMFVESKKFPYESTSALVRHALIRHIKWLHAFKEGVPSLMGQINLINDVLQAEQQAHAVLATLNKLSYQITEFVGSQDYEAAIDLINVCKKHVEGMPEGYWKRKYADKLNREYGGFMKNFTDADIVSLPLDEEEE